jgi:preprotein translocase subunit SecY
MVELYWITRFSSIHTVFVINLIISSILCAISVIGYLVNNDEEYKADVRNRKTFCYILKRAFIILVITILGTVFVPTSKEAIAIWGVGNTIDYIKQNPTAKQLPDKCIKALDAWVESLTPEEEDIKEKDNEPAR